MTPSSDDSIRRLFVDFREGDPDAARRLHERLYPRLLGIARSILARSPRRNTEPEDAVQSALGSFWRKLDAGQWPTELNGDELWGLLITMTARKARRHLRHERAAKRGGTRSPESLSEVMDDRFSTEACPASEPGVAEIEATANELIDLLPDDLRAVAVLKLMEFSHREMAEVLECNERTIQRRISDIREAWRDDTND
jgi:RNA polymerase sigma factor (sigma-70 family)